LLWDCQTQQLLVLQQSVEEGEALQEGQQIELCKLECESQYDLKRDQSHETQPQQIHPSVASQIVFAQHVNSNSHDPPPQKHQRTQREVLGHKYPQNNDVTDPRNQFIVDDGEKSSETLEETFVDLEKGLFLLGGVDGGVVGQVLEPYGCVDEERDQVEEMKGRSIRK
jgi:hypothetical protein